MHDGYLELLREQEAYTAILSSIKKNKFPVKITGTAESQKLHLAYSLCKEFGKSMVYVVPDALTARITLEDLKFFAGEDKCDLFPKKEQIFYQIEAKSSGNSAKRISVLNKLMKNEGECFIVTTIDAFCQKIVSKVAFENRSISVKTGQLYSLEELEKKFVIMGYKREFTVEAPGQFAVRGGILDVFPQNAALPYRVEFFDEEIDTIRVFDPDSQLSVESIKSIEITPANEEFSDSTSTLADFCENCFFFLEEPHHLHASYEKCISDLTDSIAAAKERLQITDKEQMAVSYYMEAYSTALKKTYKKGCIALSNLSLAAKEFSPKDILSINTKSAASYNGNLDFLIEDITYYISQKYRIILPCGGESKAKHLQTELTSKGLPSVYLPDLSKMPERGMVTLVPGTVQRGFEYPLSSSVMLSDKVFAGESRKKTALRKKSSSLRNISDIKEGDYVVHQSHGIGVYAGIERITVDGITKDYLKVKYQGTDALFVPVNQLNLINKYVGSTERIHINKLGGTEWNRTKSKAKSAVAAIAKELVELYAKRENVKGYSFSEDTPWQKEFEETFLYEETSDQLSAISDTKKDMESIKPMDRLICGDVGYGKTEVALRAAFKAIMDNKQVAYLAPTTLLVKQHYENFLQRMKNYPLKVEMLSRFRTKKQQEETVKRLKAGTCDMVIGTHRLLQDDIGFKDLGLLIVDEEQRFGVTHKEKIKTLKNNVDVLTLTATPIPRTLKMAMSGLRDMSVLNEPPQDRHPVQTYVLEYNPEVISSAIRREISRGGQVYYLYNRVETIDSFAAKIKDLVPEAKIAVAHGRMSQIQMENIMMKVIDGEVDVLICTTIIETGLDIPNVNTIIVDNADRFGLAQLHQIRGRVGRSSRMAYAYFTIMKDKVLDSVAEKRLKAIKEFTEFGAGFKLAMRDLEIRGAGNLLGQKQHGHIEQIGYELYCRLLEAAVRQLKNNEEIVEEMPITLDLQQDSYIPESYISDPDARIDVYKTISMIETESEADTVISELIDRFGEPPKVMESLIDAVLIRNLAKELGVTDVIQTKTELNLTLSAQSPIEKIVSYVSENKNDFVIRANKNTSLVYKYNPRTVNQNRNIKIILQLLKRLKNYCE
ncbi:MAG: transcription-repair coupling factor [Clostridia bacterium]|nr:transcription-repair coupling factor [Clostridia bacterium]